MKETVKCRQNKIWTRIKWADHRSVCKLAWACKMCNHLGGSPAMTCTGLWAKVWIAPIVRSSSDPRPDARIPSPPSINHGTSHNVKLQ